MQRLRMGRLVITVVTMFAMLLQGTWVLAGTTGQITGTLTDAGSKKPIAGARLTAVSPSQSANTTSDAQGRFAFLTLAPDTYAVSVDAKGYQGATVSGVTVQADQTQTLALSASAALQTIGHTTSRAATEIIKPGETADVYAINAAQAAAAAPLGGGGSLNQAYSAIASVPGVFVPIGQSGWGQSVYVRGGNYTQLGYDYDGVPVQRAYDAYPSSTLSALGNQQLQVYTGSQPGDAQSSGLAGFVNQVIKTGTYPGYSSIEGGLGSPTFYHKLQFEAAGASPNRLFSYYIGTAGYDQAFRTLDNFDGAAARYNYSPFAYGSISQNCNTVLATAGCYMNGFAAAPGGYLWTPLNYGSDPLVADRESVANVHFGIPHKKDGLKDDVQLLASVSYLFSSLFDSQSALGDGASLFATGGQTYNGISYGPCADQFAPNPVACVNPLLPISIPYGYANPNIYTGPAGGALTTANLSQVSQYVFPSQPNGVPLHGVVNPNTSGNQVINDAIFKAQYTHQMGTNAFARLYAYSLYSDWLTNDPNSGTDPFLSFFNPDYELPTHTKGFGFTVADQLGSHLLNLTGGYSTATLLRWNNGLPSTANPVAMLVDSTNPTAGCYTAAGAATSCYAANAARYVVPSTNTPATNGLQGRAGAGPTGISPTNAGSVTCGAGPCEFLAVGSGLNGSFNNVTPRFANLELSDTWNLNDKVSLNVGLRYDSFRFDVPSATMPGGPNPASGYAAGRALFTNSYDQWTCFNRATLQFPGATAPGVCPAGSVPVAFTNNNATQLWNGGFEPRLGATYKLDNFNVLRVGYGRFLQPSSTAYTFYNRTGADIANYDVPKFYAFGFTSATHPIPPAESWNFDVSWEHQVKGTDMSWKVTPFIRRTRNEDINVILDPTTNFVSAIPALSSNIQGLELLLRKGDFNRNGFAGQLSFTYTYEKSRYQILPGGFSALDNVNVSVKNYNGFTSYCAAHPTDNRCGPSSATAAPCYTGGAAGGTPDPACAPGSIANPYWNAPVQALFDPNASYFPVNQTFGTGLVSSANASSYNIPYVGALILNYKRDRWAFTPSVQFVAGGRYGSPVMGIAADPSSGCSPIAGATIAGDPRYPYGAPGGSPYLAQTCGAVNPGVAGFLVGPDPYTGKFDQPGAFIEPTQILGNLQISYQASPRLKLNLLAVNVFGTCFGGTKEPWTNDGPKIGCWYNAATGVQAGNLYNPGNVITHQAYPYFPVIGGIAGQQAYGTAVNPVQVFFTAQYRL